MASKKVKRRIAYLAGRHIEQDDPQWSAHYGCTCGWEPTNVSDRDLASREYRKHLADQIEELLDRAVADETSLTSARGWVYYGG